MNRSSLKIVTRKALSVLATAFGVLTVFVGSRTLLGFSDPGYTIFYPLLLFNAIMGLFYTAAGVFIWIDHKKQVQTSLLILVVNLLMLLLMLTLSLLSTEIATESFKAMTFRTGFWLVIYITLRTYLKK
ncbi:hypothetical protein NC796_06265 [Aliifodinibius sp. S!AR15-10]|uniref:hypothetical protein n=1 Tax=Aliifodinibius sp. S!AR15-10 TaxID=2950437 RepID=UPI002856FFFD|nr:hypothetical protein [Aliifodinibius sp. S!AR15-10]MDR8390731.1 hypothetical protein [Aliifodinibius sp. S!AR15-10]